MDQNLEKLVKLLEKDREIFQMLRQCPYEILRRFEVKDYEADQFVLNQGESRVKKYGFWNWIERSFYNGSGQIRILMNI